MARQVLPLAALLLGMVFLMLGGGLHGLLIPVRGQLEGFSSFSLGWIGTGYAVGFTFGCVAVPRLVRRAGHVRAFSALTALMSISILGMGLAVHPIGWIVLRALSGFCFAGCYMVAESWLNEQVSNEMRGRLFSVYAITTMVAMAGGQYLLVLAEPTEDTLFMLGAVLFALAVLPTAVSTAASPAPLSQVKLDVGALFRNSPAAVVGSFLSGVISSAWTNFGPVFGTQVGFGSATLASLLALALAGSVIFQYPLGRLSDVIDRRYVMVVAGVLGAAAGMLMVWLANQGEFGAVFFAAVVLYGGVIYSIYSLAVAHGNDYAEADQFVQVSSGLLIMYGFGTMAGPLFTAQLMDMVGPSGVFTATTLAHGALAVYAGYRTFKRPALAHEERNDYQILALARTQTPESYVLDPRSYLDDAGEEVELPPMLPPVEVEAPEPAGPDVPRP